MHVLALAQRCGGSVCGGRALQQQVHRQRTAAGLGAGVDAYHRGAHAGAAVLPLQTQLGALAQAHLQGIGWCQQGFEFQLARIHNFQHPCFYTQALAVVRQALRHLAVDGAAQHCVVQRLACQFHTGLGGQVVGLGCIPVGLRGLQRGGRDKALAHQGAVVLQLALGNGQLGSGGLGLLFSLAQAGGIFCGVDLRQCLARAHAVALAHLQALQLARSARLHKSLLPRLEDARYRQIEL